MALLDTTVFVDLHGRGGKRRMAEAEDVLRRLSGTGEAFYTSRVNVAELYVGVELSQDPIAESDAIDDYLRWIAILELDDKAAHDFGRIRAELQRQGKLVGDLDMLIAGIALSNDQPLITRNPEHFRNVPGLTVIGYGTPSR